MISGSADGSLWLWNGNNGENLGVLTGHEKPITKCGFTPDGKSIVSASDDQSLRIWNPKSV